MTREDMVSGFEKRTDSFVKVGSGWLVCESLPLSEILMPLLRVVFNQAV